MLLLVLSLPVFPSEDGPVHVYYATVLATLLSGSHGPLTAAFRIRHLLPPYSPYYYMLIVLLKFFPALLVEQIMVCITIVILAVGFRRMCIAAGAGRDQRSEGPAGSCQGDPQWAKVLFRKADLVVFRDEFHTSSAAAAQKMLHENGRPRMRCVERDWLYFCRADGF